MIKITNNMILLIMFIQFCFLMYQISKLSNICNEAFVAIESTDLQTQIATFYQADIAAIQSLGNVAKALISGGNLVPGNLTIGGNLTISGNLTVPNIINTPTFINGIGVPMLQTINLQSDAANNNNTTDTISVGIHDSSALCIVGHGNGIGNNTLPRKIHLWDNVVVDNNLSVNNDIKANSGTINSYFTVNSMLTVNSWIKVKDGINIGNWDIYDDGTALFFQNKSTRQGIKLANSAGTSIIQPIDDKTMPADWHARFER